MTNNLGIDHSLGETNADLETDIRCGAIPRPRVFRIVLADPQQIFRDGVKRLLESDPQFVVVGGATDASQAMQMVRELDPDVLLLDLAMPQGGGFEVLKQLAAGPARVRTIALTVRGPGDVQAAALQHGARLVILKDSASELLFESIRTLFDDLDGRCRDDVGQTADAMSPHADPVPPEKTFRLTRREMDVVRAVAAGESNKGIAELLSLSEDTVKHHVSNVFDKLGVFSRLELALFAMNHNLVDIIISSPNYRLNR